MRLQRRKLSIKFKGDVLILIKGELVVIYFVFVSYYGLISYALIS